MRSVKFSLLAGLLALSVTGCADDQEGIIFDHVPAWGDDCTVDVGSILFLQQGSLDLFFGTAYLMPGVVTNRFPSVNSLASPNGIDDAEVFLSDAIVSLSMPQAPEIMDSLDSGLTDFTLTLASTSIPAGGSAGVLIEAIPQQTAAALRPLVAANGASSLEVVVTTTVRAHRSASGTKASLIEARPFTFPVSVSVGGLVDCTPCLEASIPCDEANAETNYVGGQCGNAQDAGLVPIACQPDDGGP